MRFLFVFISYPNVEKDNNMYSALVHELARIGHEIKVIAPVFESSTKVSQEGGISVIRVRSGALFNTNVVSKSLNMILLNFRYRNAMRRFWPDSNFDWIITSTPPITLSGFLRDLKTKCDAKLYLILRDIFPQNARDLGLIRDPFIFLYFRKKEKHMYSISNIIGCMSSKNIQFILEHNLKILESKSVTYFPNWIKPSCVSTNSELDTHIKNRFDFVGKFVVVFGGNLGKPQKIDFILDLAHEVREEPKIVFYIIGKGTEKARIKKRILKEGMTNVRLFDLLPRDTFQSILRQADLGLVNLSDRFTIPNIPSRTLGYWDASLAVLAATDRNTDLNDEFLKKFDAGLWVETGDIDQYLHQFLKLYNNDNRRKRMGKNGRIAVETEFSAQAAAKRLINHIEEEA
jgi:glycosyltransferase involved in cell wall biosynthesis